MDIYRLMGMRKVFPNLLNERSAEYISRTRAEALSKSFEYGDKANREEVWSKAEAPLRDLAALVKGNGGPFTLGTTRELLNCSFGNTFQRSGCGYETAGLRE
jgi:hypothetical protein